jgi:hypothetical protein
MKKYSILINTFLLLFVGISSVNAQCGRFMKKESLPQLAPFTHNGQLNSSVLYAGDEAEMLLTFYSGHTYRLLVDAQPILDTVSFKVFDKKKNLLYNSKDDPDKKYWDFNVAKSQQLRVVVNVPKSKNQNNIKLTENGCVAILVGFKTDEEAEELNISAKKTVK